MPLDLDARTPLPRKPIHIASGIRATLSALRDPDPIVRAVAADRVVRIWPTHLAQLRPIFVDQTKVEWGDCRIDHGTLAAYVVDSVCGLKAAGRAELLRVVRSDSVDDGARTRAVRCVFESTAPGEALRELGNELVHSKSSAVATAAIAMVGGFNNVELLDILISRSADPDPQIRAVVAGALASLLETQSKGTLHRLLRNSSLDVQSTAARTLVQHWEFETARVRPLLDQIPDLFDRLCRGKSPAAIDLLEAYAIAHPDRLDDTCRAQLSSSPIGQDLLNRFDALAK